MPGLSDHSALASKNASVLEYLKNRIDDFPEWVVTVAFYEALHNIEAAMASEKDVLRTSCHKDRNELIRTHPNYKSIYYAYKSLYDVSCIARYMHHGTINFSAYMPRAQIESVVLANWLYKVKQFSAHRIKQSAP